MGGKPVFGQPKTHEHRTVVVPRFVFDGLTPGERLVFTAPKGGHLRTGNFRRNVWLPRGGRMWSRGPSGPRPTGHSSQPRHRLRRVDQSRSTDAWSCQRGHDWMSMEVFTTTIWRIWQTGWRLDSHPTTAQRRRKPDTAKLQRCHSGRESPGQTRFLSVGPVGIEPTTFG